MSTRPEKKMEKRALATLCKAASDSLRLDILRVLSRDSFGVQELASIFLVPQPGMSHHLKILFKSGLVVTRRQGNSIFYRRALLRGESDLDRFQSSLYATIDSDSVPDSHTKRINRVYKERSLRSRHYFERNANQFEENQGMLCELNQYLPNLRELLDLMKLPNPSRAMEVGPGQGLLLQELAKHFDKLVALDNSGQMLERTRARVEKSNKNVEFINCSLESYPSENSKFDAVVLNMVMHHMPSPAQTFQKLKNLTFPNGYVVLADLCLHDQDWARESCGDLWLGFDPQDLTEWANDAGFKEKQGLYLGLKNGFQIQLKLFYKENPHGK